MGDKRRAACRLCKRHRTEVGEISWGGYCGDCGLIVMDANIIEMRYHTGESLLRWRRAMAASVGAILIEDLDSHEDAA